MSSKLSETKVFVGQLSKKVRSSDLEGAFGKYGKIKDVEMKTNHAFVEFENPRDAEEAVDEMDGKSMLDCKITVQFKGANRKNSSHRGPTSGDVCYNCGKKGHWANECRAGDWKNRCYKCGTKGHLQKDCPKSKSHSRSRKNHRRSRSHNRRSRSRDRSRDRERSRSNHRRRSRRYRSVSSSSRSRSRSRSDTKSKSRSKSKSAKKSVSRSRSGSKSKSRSRRREKMRSSPSR